MKIAVIGTGSVGAALGAKWGAAGHTVIYGSRDPSSERIQALLARTGPSAKAENAVAAVQEAHAIILALPWGVTQAALASLGSLRGRIVVDCTNPLLSDLSGIELGHSTSAAEQIAAWAPGAKVVKSFNTASVKVMNDPVFGEHRATMFYCGDDPDAKEVVRQLVADVGFDPVDAGGLASARYLEPLAMLYIHLAFKQGWGSNCAFKIMKR